MEEIWRNRNLAVFDEIHAPNFSDRSPARRASDRTSYRQSIVELFAAFPDWEAITEDLVIDVTTSKVAVRWTATGTHRGAFLGLASSCKRITFRGMRSCGSKARRLSSAGASGMASNCFSNSAQHNRVLTLRINPSARLSGDLAKPLTRLNFLA